MNPLDTTQYFVTRWITSPSGDPGALRTVEAAEEHITHGPRLSPHAQLEIYRQQYVLRHTESVAEDYPGLCALVGDAKEALLKAYVEEAMPCVEALRDLGSQMAFYLEKKSTLEGLLRERAISMARLEWAYQLALESPAQHSMDWSAFGELSEDAWPSVRFTRSHALSLLDLAYPAAEHRRHLLGRSAEEVFEGRTYYAIYRNRDGVAVDLKLSPTAYALLRGLAEGLTLGDACEGALSFDSHSASSLEAELSTWFQSWAQAGILTGYIPPPMDRP